MTTSNPAPILDVSKIRADFPVLHQKVNGKPLVYMDTGATSQKPQSVIDALVRYYTEDNSNVHRGVHTLSQRATEEYDTARSKTRQFLNAASDQEIIFVKGTTDGINLVAHSYGRQHLGPGDEIIISTMEHHSNIIPWQVLCQEKAAHLRIIPINDAGELLIDEYERLLTPRTKLVSITHVSNVLGTINPIEQIVEMAHSRGVPVLVDGAQAAPHMAVDVQKLGCDFYVFSGHKLYGPTGIGVLYGKFDLLEAMPPYQLGSDMIKSVTFESTIYNDLPYKFEAGTPHIAGVIGLGAAIDYVTRIGMETIAAHDRKLARLAAERLSTIPGVRLIGEAADKTSIASFVLEHAHPHDIGTILDNHGVAIRAGHHCAQPVMQHFGVEATARASFSLYNTERDIDRLIEAVLKVKEVFV